MASTEPEKVSIRVTRSSEHLEKYREFSMRWQDHLRRDARKVDFRQPPPQVTLTAEYNLLSDETAFHSHATGWRMVPDIIVDTLVQAALTDPVEDPQAQETHMRYRALQRAHLAYPFLASWRLCIEVALKETIVAVTQALDVELAGRSRKEMRGHNIAYLWKSLGQQLGALNPLLQDLSTDLGLVDAPGFHPENARAFDSAIDQLVAIDPDGQALRYEAALDGSRNMGNVSTVNISEMHQELGGLYAWLGHMRWVARGMKELMECEASIDALSQRPLPDEA